jgi:hypothetical protein
MRSQCFANGLIATVWLDHNTSVPSKDPKLERKQSSVQVRKIRCQRTCAIVGFSANHIYVLIFGAKPRFGPCDSMI